uniref:Uncharacterized protein n=1 Tax=viral metagenome TaxID=1070528 RepID=A0A6C0DB15_9ZZZZ
MDFFSTLLLIIIVIQFYKYQDEYKRKEEERIYNICNFLKDKIYKKNKEYVLNKYQQRVTKQYLLNQNIISYSTDFNNYLTTFVSNSSNVYSYYKYNCVK